ncbi:MAG: 30S ribosomal protein S1, partial [bacterium]|nr:30S ribosomal protein S1 [bacterium]
VTPGEELWVKIIDIDLQRRRISLSIKQAAEGGVVSAEFQEAFGEHAFDEEGNYLGAVSDDEPGEAGEEFDDLSGDGNSGDDLSGDDLPADAESLEAVASA